MRGFDSPLRLPPSLFSMEKTKFILFDFDGTIADTVNPIVNILNDLSEHFGYRKIDKEIFEHFRSKRNQDALKEVGMPLYKILLIVRRVHKEVKSKINEIKPIVGIGEILVRLVKDGHRIGIVTTGSKENVEAFLKNNNFKRFEFIYAGKRFFGKGKILKRLLKKHGLSAAEVVYVGDQTSDIEAARQAGIKVVAVGWGFNSETILRQSNPDVFVNNPDELENSFQSL
jgi:phosphoglycolate phosphatase